MLYSSAIKSRQVDKNTVPIYDTILQKKEAKSKTGTT